MIAAEDIRGCMTNQVEHIAPGLAGRVGSNIYYLLISGIFDRVKPVSVTVHLPERPSAEAVISVSVITGLSSLFDY